MHCKNKNIQISNTPKILVIRLGDEKKEVVIKAIKITEYLKKI